MQPMAFNNKEGSTMNQFDQEEHLAKTHSIACKVRDLFNQENVNPLTALSVALGIIMTVKEGAPEAHMLFFSTMDIRPFIKP
jgi:hypothetical protein